MSENVPKTLKTHFWRCHGNFSRSGIYLSVHDMINDVAASLLIFLFVLRYKYSCQRFLSQNCENFHLVMTRTSETSQRLPNIPDNFPKTSELCWRCLKMFWLLWALLKLFKRRQFFCVVILFVHKVNIKHFLEHFQGNWIELSLWIIC